MSRTETQLKAMVAGIPATWADADLLRQNGYQVLEKGSLEQMFLLPSFHWASMKRKAY